jgi:hypothetical protein
VGAQAHRSPPARPLNAAAGCVTRARRIPLASPRADGACASRETRQACASGAVIANERPSRTRLAHAKSSFEFKVSNLKTKGSAQASLHSTRSGRFGREHGIWRRRKRGRPARRCSSSPVSHGAGRGALDSGGINTEGSNPPLRGSCPLAFNRSATLASVGARPLRVLRVANGLPRGAVTAFGSCPSVSRPSGVLKTISGSSPRPIA